MAHYRVWLSESELLPPLEFEADSPEQARMKTEQLIFERTLFQEASVDMSEGCLAVDSIGLVE